MGNGSSLRIQVLPEDVPCEAGTTLQGRVVLSTKKAVQGDELQIILSGKEKVCVKKEKGKRQAERPIVSLNATLRDGSQQQIQPGNYLFPFSIALPMSLPSTTKHPSNTSSKLGLRIQYKLRAKFGRVRAVHSVWITSAPLPNEQVPRVVNPTVHKLTSMRQLISRGSCSIGARVEDSRVGRESFIALHLASQNDSTTEVRRVSIQLVENLTWSTSSVDANSGRFTERLILIKQKDVDLPGVMKGKKTRSELKANSNVDSTFIHIYEALMSGQNLISFQVPKFARDSYAGQLVSIQHELEIKLLTGPLASNPVVKIPIRIGNRSATENQLNQLVATPLNVLAVAEAEYVVQPEIHPEYEHIPVAPSFLIEGEATEAPLVVVSENVIVLGGEAFVRNETDLADLVPMPPPTRSIAVSVASLLQEMATSVSDFDILENRVGSSEWRELFQDLTPQDFGSIVAHVNYDTDQIRCALLVSSNISLMTCQHAACVIQNTVECNRCTMTQRLIPLCTDIDCNSSTIRSVLNAWELVVTLQSFEDAQHNPCT